MMPLSRLLIPSAFPALRCTSQARGRISFQRASSCLASAFVLQTIALAASSLAFSRASFCPAVPARLPIWALSEGTCRHSWEAVVTIW